MFSVNGNIERDGGSVCVCVRIKKSISRTINAEASVKSKPDDDDRSKCDCELLCPEGLDNKEQNQDATGRPHDCGLFDTRNNNI